VRTRLASALTGVAALTLSLGLAGCGSDLGPDLHPGRAAVVGDEDVSFDEVDDFAESLCAWQEPSMQVDGLAWPMSYVKAVAVDSIVDDLLTHQFAEEKHFEPAAGYKEALAQIRTDVAAAKLPAEVGPTVIAFRGREVYHQAIMVTAGLTDLAGQGKTADQQGALERGEEIFADWRDDADVSLDPRYGTVSGAALDYAPPADSLSVSVSDRAKRAAAGQDDKEYVESLPASQRCGGD
jgi:hypothetical protein